MSTRSTREVTLKRRLLFSFYTLHLGIGVIGGGIDWSRYTQGIPDNNTWTFAYWFMAPLLLLALKETGPREDSRASFWILRLAGADLVVLYFIGVLALAR